MANKQTALRVIDMATAQVGSDGIPVASEALSTSAPRIDLIPGPKNVTVSGQATFRSTAAPQIAATITWSPATGQRFDYFIVEYDTVSTFTTAEKVQSYSNVATLILKPATTYYVRVSAAFEQTMSLWSDTLSFATISDSTAPPTPGSLDLDWYRGDLYIVAPITNTDLVKDVRIQIWNAAQTVLLDTQYTAAPYLFTAEENRRVHGGTPSATVVIVVHSRGWNNVISGAGITQSTTSPAPGTITGLTSNWASDTGTESADLIVSWTADPQASEYIIQFNNNSAFNYKTADIKFVYTWEQNAKNSPPSGLYTMPIRVYGINKISQSGIAQTATHTNAAPTASGATLSAFVGFSQIIGQLAHVQINDVLGYTYTLVPASGSPVVYNSGSREVTLPIPSVGLWTLRANIIDRFGRASSNIDSTQFYSDSITISGLRSAATYSDSQSTDPGVLNGLKDNILTTVVVTHNNTGAGSRWTQFDRPFVDRYKTTTITTSGAMRFYIQATANDSNYKYYGSPVSAAGVLTEYASSALAQTNYITHSGIITRYDLPAMIEAKTIRIVHWTGAGSYGLNEYYPRRLVQSDDIEAETIKTINLGASSVTADKIFVLNLAAINIATGNLTISGVLTIASGTGSGLYQGTGTFASPTTGLKIWRDTSGIGRLTTYSGGIAQIDIGTDGKLTAGSVGGVRLSENGFESLGSSSQFYKTTYGGSPSGRIKFLDDSVLNTFRFEWFSASNNYRRLDLDTNGIRMISSFGSEIFIEESTGLVKINTSTEITKTASTVGSEVGHIELHDSGTTAKYLYAGWDSALNGGNGAGYIQSIYTGVAYHNMSLNPAGGYVQLGGGNTAPNRILTIRDNTTPQIGLGTNSTDKWIIGFEPGASDRFIMYNYANGYQMMINVDGNTAIGVNTSPSATTKLLIKGRTSANTDNALAVQNSSGTNLVLVRDDGASNTTIVAWTLISARDEKDNIRNTDKGLKDLLKLTPRRYSMKRLGDSDKYHGFVAEELIATFPELVDDVAISDTETVKGIRYGDLIPILVKAVQELSSDVELLKTK